MPWYIVSRDGEKKEAFRSEGEARRASLDYLNCEIRFIPSSKLQAKRVQKGLSQNELAKLTNVTTRSIRAWERGDVNINRAAVEDILKISKVLQCNIEDLLE